MECYLALGNSRGFSKNTGVKRRSWLETKIPVNSKETNINKNLPTKVEQSSKQQNCSQMNHCLFPSPTTIPNSTLVRDENEFHNKPRRNRSFICFQRVYRII